MITPNSDLCRQAEPHYYGYLCAERAKLVPEQILTHIDKCSYCQAEADGLKSKLAGAAECIDPDIKQTNSAIITNLGRHFAYIDQCVTCNTVRPFLPFLLEPALEIRIPTPITAHLDNCRQCRQDLKTLRGFDLTSKQLHRLSQLFANESVEDSVGCSTVLQAIPSIAAMDWNNLTTEILNHLCRCLVCRVLLYEERQKIYNSLPEYTETPEFPCESVSTSDIFDYCLPYGIDPANDEYVKFRKSLTSHLCKCPTCLAKVQKLHKAVCHIVERPESGVVTICTMDKSTEAKITSKSDDLYAGFPLKVEVTNSEDQIKTKISTLPAAKRGFPTTKLRPLIRAAVAAAAVILIASVFFLNTSTAGAVTIEQIYKAIDKIKNVYITRFIPDKTEPLQERWVSKTFNVYLTKTADEYVLWDIGNSVKKSESADTGEVETTRLSGIALSSVKERMSGSLGLIPFNSMSEIPLDSEWIQVIDENPEAAIENIKIYDIVWSTRQYNDLITFNKWRFFVDFKTNLPQRTEFYQKLFADDEYTLVSVSVIRYLDDSEMRIILKEISF